MLLQVYILQYTILKWPPGKNIDLGEKIKKGKERKSHQKGGKDLKINHLGL